MNNDFYIVSSRILPDYFGKVIEARELIRSGKARDVSQAVKMVGISRSTYYKYKDDVFLPSEGDNGKKAVFSMILHHRPGILEQVLSILAENGVNILTITQNPPIQDRASVVVSMDISELSCGVSDLLVMLEANPGVENPRLIDMA
jgi:chorismate mutase